MTSSAVAKTSGRVPRRTDQPVRPDEERIGQRYEARRRRRSRFMRWTFLAAVAAPTVIAAFYYCGWAAPRYVSETQFIVRTAEGNKLGGGSALEGLLQAIGISRSTDDSNAVLRYLQSRDAVANLESALPLRQIYARQGADPLARFPRPFFGDSFERLYWYYGDRVTAWADQDSGIITVQAQAFRPDDAQAIARQLLSQAEGLVNAMNARLEAELCPKCRGGRGRGAESGSRHSGGRGSISQQRDRCRSNPECDRPARHDYGAVEPGRPGAGANPGERPASRPQTRRRPPLKPRPTRWRRRSPANRKRSPDRRAQFQAK